HMTAIAEAAIVIGAAVVRMPQVNERALDWPAAAGEHIACKLDGPAAPTRLDQIEPLGRARAIERAFGLGQRRRIVVLAFGRRREIGLCPSIAGTSTAGGSDPGIGAVAENSTAADDGHAQLHLLNDRTRAIIGHHSVGELSRARHQTHNRVTVRPPERPRHSATRTRDSMASTAPLAVRSLPASRARSTTLV